MSNLEESELLQYIQSYNTSTRLRLIKSKKPSSHFLNDLSFDVYSLTLYYLLLEMTSLTFYKLP